MNDEIYLATVRELQSEYKNAVNEERYEDASLIMDNIYRVTFSCYENSLEEIESAKGFLPCAFGDSRSNLLKIIDYYEQKASNLSESLSRISNLTSFGVADFFGKEAPERNKD